MVTLHEKPFEPAGRLSAADLFAASKAFGMLSPRVRNAILFHFDRELKCADIPSKEESRAILDALERAS